jgi:hypothetical protein
VSPSHKPGPTITLRHYQQSVPEEVKAERWCSTWTCLSRSGEESSGMKWRESLGQLAPPASRTWMFAAFTGFGPRLWMGNQLSELVSC